MENDLTTPDLTDIPEDDEAEAPDADVQHHASAEDVEEKA